MKSLVGGTILTDDRISKYFPLLVVVAIFGLALIMHRNSAERTIRKIEVLQKELVGLRAEHATVSAKLMDASRPSEVVRKVEDAGLGLKEPVRPLRKINVTKED